RPPQVTLPVREPHSALRTKRIEPFRRPAIDADDVVSLLAEEVIGRATNANHVDVNTRIVAQMRGDQAGEHWAIRCLRARIDDHLVVPVIVATYQDAVVLSTASHVHAH